MSFGDILLIMIKFAGDVVVFAYGTKLVSEGLPKETGSKMRNMMGQMTNSTHSSGSRHAVLRIIVPGHDDFATTA